MIQGNLRNQQITNCHPKHRKSNAQRQGIVVCHCVQPNRNCCLTNRNCCWLHTMTNTGTAPAGAKPRTPKRGHGNSTAPFILSHSVIVLRASSDLPVQTGDGGGQKQQHTNHDLCRAPHSVLRDWDPGDYAAAQRAVREWSEYTHSLLLKFKMVRRSPSFRTLRLNLLMWARASVGVSLAKRHALRHLLIYVLPKRRRRTALTVLR